MGREKYIKPIERITHPKEISKYIDLYFIENNWIDLSCFLPDELNYIDAPDSFVLNIAKMKERSGKYTYQIQSGTGHHLLYAKPKGTWYEEHPITMHWISGGIAALLSLVVGLFLFQLDSRKQDRIDTQQDRRLDTLSDQLDNLQENIDHLQKDTTSR